MFRCGGKDHLQRPCFWTGVGKPDPTIRCLICSQYGHIAVQCGKFTSNAVNPNDNEMHAIVDHLMGKCLLILLIIYHLSDHLTDSQSDTDSDSDCENVHVFQNIQVKNRVPVLVDDDGYDRDTDDVIDTCRKNRNIQKSFKVQTRKKDKFNKSSLDICPANTSMKLNDNASSPTCGDIDTQLCKQTSSNSGVIPVQPDHTSTVSEQSSNILDIPNINQTTTGTESSDTDLHDGR
ncbi:hypothetical protein KUTeg_023896 [Tegillarca granosa]|uniref:CCHC-type domain-containing protein n=1 Tax=Tegillarca granosa TaxID=220873 RepID=A0ABQ9DZ57_TEGGR|nr:hypothetical protein KUTeg_023896 [Tegillarca granosa]